MRAVSGLIVAARYLTIVPIPGRPNQGVDRLGAAAPWFPVVGLAIGAVLVVVERLTHLMFPPMLGALLVVTAWKLATGGLHLDGLADCLDGLVGRDPAHRLAIMRDSRIGAFGAIGLILVLLLEIAALAELPAPWRTGMLLVAPAVARATPVVLAQMFSSARQDGHGAAFRAGLRWSSAPIALLVATASAAAVLGWLGLVVMVAALGAAMALGAFLGRRLSGITGDVLGAAIEVAELTALLVVSAWVHAGL
jgi:adenosylcobinamide-GDP ribazoletransferase